MSPTETITADIKPNATQTNEATTSTESSTATEELIFQAVGIIIR